MKKRILFVDDEVLVLQGLQRMLRPMREDWDMEFLDSKLWVRAGKQNLTLVKGQKKARNEKSAAPAAEAAPVAEEAPAEEATAPTEETGEATE